MILYGLRTCDTCRKAFKALEEAGHEVRFQDVRAEPLSPAQIAAFDAHFGAALVNRASTTWRGLSDAERGLPVADLLRQYPALMKRPLIEAPGGPFLGWKPEVQARLLN